MLYDITNKIFVDLNTIFFMYLDFRTSPSQPVKFGQIWCGRRLATVHSPKRKSLKNHDFSKFLVNFDLEFGGL